MQQPSSIAAEQRQRNHQQINTTVSALQYEQQLQQQQL